MMPSISSSVLGGVFIFSAFAGLVGGVDRGVSSTVFMPADATRYSIASKDLPPAGHVAIADLAFLAGPAPQQPVFSGGDVPTRPGVNDMSQVYFDPNPLTNVELPVWNVFRVGVGFQHVSKFRKAPAPAGKHKAPVVTEKLPVGCDPMVSPVANRVLAQIPVSCVS
jgi:hypothetical protein